MGHLMKDENNFLSFSDFTDRYNIETNFLTFQGVLSAVKALWKSNVANFHKIQSCTNQDSVTSKIRASSGSSECQIVEICCRDFANQDG